MLAELLGSRSRARVIAALLVAPERRLHVRALVRAAGGSVASVQREVERLEDMGLVTSAIDAAGRRHVALVEDHPFVTPLAGMLAADPSAQYEARSGRIPRLDPDVDTALESAVDTIVARFDPIKIVLFGSQAVGTASTDSDIDLLVVFPEVKDVAGDAATLRCAIGAVGRGVDIVPTDPAHIEAALSRRTSAIRDALETGVTLYDRSI
jgi:predicted nucleotidyltransferase